MVDVSAAQPCLNLCDLCGSNRIYGLHVRSSWHYIQISWTFKLFFKQLLDCEVETEERTYMCDAVPTRTDI
jgi:hypothetical protein